VRLAVRSVAEITNNPVSPSGERWTPETSVYDREASGVICAHRWAATNKKENQRGDINGIV
jgi:hypothetical protein